MAKREPLDWLRAEQTQEMALNMALHDPLNPPRRLPNIPELLRTIAALEADLALTKAGTEEAFRSIALTLARRKRFRTKRASKRRAKVASQLQAEMQD